MSSFLSESETAQGWLSHKESFYLFAANKEMQGMVSKAMTPRERVNGFLLFRLRLNI